MGELIVILGLTIIAPIWILGHYATKWRLAKGISTDESRLLEDLWEIAERMEQRVVALETILDENVEDWRRKA